MLHPTCAFASSSSWHFSAPTYNGQQRIVMSVIHAKGDDCSLGFEVLTT